MKKIIGCFFAVAWLSVSMSTPAQAFPVVGILTFFGIEATLTAVAITSFVLQTAMPIGLSYVPRAVTRKPGLKAETDDRY